MCSVKFSCTFSIYSALLCSELGVSIFIPVLRVKLGENPLLGGDGGGDIGGRFHLFATSVCLLYSVCSQLKVYSLYSVCSL